MPMPEPGGCPRSGVDRPDAHTTASDLADLREHRAAERPSAAQDRINRLVDEGSWTSLDEFAADGVRTGHGLVDGRTVCIFAQGPQPLGERGAARIGAVMDLALTIGSPVVGIHDFGPAPEPGVIAGLLRRRARASGVIPHLSLVLGSGLGAETFLPTMGDFVVMVDENSHLAMASPEVLSILFDEDSGTENFGGAHLHASTTGVAHYLAANEADATAFVVDLLTYLPSNNLDAPAPSDEVTDPAATEDDLALDVLIPDSANLPYDVTTAVRGILDDGEFLQTQTHFAPHLVTGFGRVDGRPVGVVANQPLYGGAALDLNASEKGARFVRTCDAFNLPVVTFIDSIGLQPISSEEHGVMVRRGATLAFAYAEATVPLITVVTRNARSDAFEVMGSKSLGADLCFAWPSARLGAAEETSLYAAVERGDIDGLIAPSETRPTVARALRMLASKQHSRPPKKFGNLPL